MNKVMAKFVGIFLMAVAACSQPAATQSECAPGALGCACDEGSCADGVACVAGMCSAAAASEVRVLDPAARACELVLHDDTHGVANLQLDDTVQGQLRRQGEHVAVAFIRMSDTPFADESVRVAFRTTDNNAEVVTSRCYDRLGRPLAEKALAFD